MTYKKLLEQTKEHFANLSAAEYFLQGITNKKRYELYADTTEVSEELLTRFYNLLKTKRPDMPVQYLLHKAYFLSYELYVDERVMIPRFETEELVVKVAGKIKNPEIILDIGTGSGAIAIALADYFPEAKIVATDISNDALVVAKINVRKYGLSDRISLSHADLFPPTENMRGKIDLIISNPPYIPNSEIACLSPSIKDYEPHLALGGGKDGFEIIQRIIEEAIKWLSSSGLVALEINPRQTDLINNLVPFAEFEKDNQELFRFVFIKNSGKNKSDHV